VLLWLLVGIGLLCLLLVTVRWAASADPKTLLLVAKTAAIAVFVVAGGFLLLRGGLGWIVALLPVLLPFALRWRRLGTATLGGIGAGGSPGQSSRVRTRFFDMRLDHETGELDGDVLEGPHAGRSLSELDVADLVAMLPRVRAEDSKSARLLEAYLDRRHPNWRADRPGGQASDGGAEDGAGETGGSMTTEDAYRVLGLTAGASEAEIRNAHQRLIRHLHPDRGGSSFLAAQVNRARDVLLGTHRR